MTTSTITELSNVLGTSDNAWVRGNVDLVDQIPHAIAVTGSRASTRYGDEVAANLGRWLTSDQHTIVTGGSFGIDTAVLRAALVADAKPIVVLPCGIDRTHPSANSALFDAILATGGLLVSLEEPDAVPTRVRFHLRSSWIGTMTAGTIIVEAAGRSGALITATAADLAEKHIAAVPGPITSATSQGAHQLIHHAGAHLVYDEHTARTFAGSAVEAAQQRSGG